jgi:glutathione S-transferase
MYKLPFVPDWASLAVRLVLEEFNIPYEDHLIDETGGERQTAEFIQYSPLSKIPVLLTDDGSIFETSAILLWLSERHAGMAPPSSSRQRASFLKWFMFVNNYIQNNFYRLVHPQRFSSEESAKITQALALKDILEGLDAIEIMLEKDSPEWMSTSPPSILSYYIALIARWLNGITLEQKGEAISTQYPRLHQLLLELEARPTARRCADIEGLGDTIFTRPTLV